MRSEEPLARPEHLEVDPVVRPVAAGVTHHRVERVSEQTSDSNGGSLSGPVVMGFYQSVDPST